MAVVWIIDSSLSIRTQLREVADKWFGGFSANERKVSSIDEIAQSTSPLGVLLVLLHFDTSLLPLAGKAFTDGVCQLLFTLSRAN
jgi:hypothetical protein